MSRKKFLQKMALVTAAGVGLASVETMLNAPSASAVATDELVKATVNDMTAGYLSGSTKPKIAVVSPIATTILNPGANEQLQISSLVDEVVPASYIIWKNGSTYVARNGQTGLDDVTPSSDPIAVIRGAINQLTNGGVIYVKPGTYVVNSATYPANTNVITLQSNISIIGEPGATIFTNSTPVNHTLFQGTGLVNVSIRGITWRTTLGAFCSFTSCTNVLIDECYVDHTNTTSIIISCVCNGCTNAKITRSTFIANSSSPDLTGCTDSSVTHCYITQNADSGIVVTWNGTAPSVNCIVANNTVDILSTISGKNPPGIEVTNSQFVVVANNTIRGQSGTPTFGSEAIVIEDTGVNLCNHVICIGNHISNYGGAGILVSAAKNVVVADNTLLNCAVLNPGMGVNAGIYVAGCTNVTVNGNQLDSCGYLTNASSGSIGFFNSTSIVFSANTITNSGGASPIFDQSVNSPGSFSTDVYFIANIGITNTTRLAPRSTVRLIQNRPLQPQGVSAITVGASPFTYTNNDFVPEAIYITPGSMGAISQIAKNSVNLLNANLAGQATVWLEPGESVVVTYSTTASMFKDMK